jgi:segregation and condensation protein A
MLGVTLDWMDLRAFLPSRRDAWTDPQLRRSALASSFVAALELAKQGSRDRAGRMFGPLMLRAAQS